MACSVAHHPAGRNVSFLAATTATTATSSPHHNGAASSSMPFLRSCAKRVRFAGIGQSSSRFADRELAARLAGKHAFRFHSAGVFMFPSRVGCGERRQELKIALAARKTSPLSARDEA